jgi:hypothetical protein
MIDVRRVLALVALGSGCWLDTSGTAGRPDAEAQPFDASFDGGRRDAFVAPDATFDAGTDAGPLPDAGPENFYDLAWGDPVALTSTADPMRCETDPVVTTDLRWLYVSRPEAALDDCYRSRRFHVFEYNDGAPVYVTILPRFDGLHDENNAHPTDGAVAGRPGRVLFFYQSSFAAFTDIRMVELTGDAAPISVTSGPNTIVSGALGPTLTADGTHMIFSAGGMFHELTGTPPSSWGAPVPLATVSGADDEGDPALSADGRVLVFFVRSGPEEPDLWVARRREPTMAFDDPIRLPAPINSASAEMDSFLTAAGDLLYMSNRDGSRRVYLARRVR